MANEMSNENIIYGGPVGIDVTKDVKSLGEYILRELSVLGDKVAIIDGITDRQITCREIKEGSLKMAAYFQRLGIREGDVIGITSENCLEYPLIVYGAYYLGAAITTCNLTYNEDEMRHAMNLSKPKIVFASPFAIFNLESVVKQCPSIKELIQLGEVQLLDGVTMFNDIIADPTLQISPEFVPAPVNMVENVAMIMLSSGTTGLPKGVQITQNNVLASVSNSMESKQELNHDYEIVLLSILPWFHVYGLMTMIHVTCAGVRLIMLPKFEEDSFLHSIEKYKPTSSFMVPPLMVFLAKHPLVDKYDMTSLRELYCGAAPLSQEVEMAVLKRLPHIECVRQGYGMSETTLGVITSREKTTKPGSVGILSPGVYCKIIDPDTGAILGPYQSGELCFKGKIVMKGYVGDRKATQETIDKDGWLHTGDVAYFDKDHHFYIVDRLKELIKYKAFQVAPAELEAILLSHPKVQDAAVIGLPDEDSGELPLAFVVKQANVENVTEKEIVDFVASKVSHSKRLRGGVRFIDEIPKNLSGKILRRELKALLKIKSKL